MYLSYYTPNISTTSVFMSYCWLPVGNETVLAIAKMKLKNYRKLKCDFIYGLISLCDFSSLKDHSRKRTHRYLANQILPQFLCNRLSLLCLYLKVPAVYFLQYCFCPKIHTTGHLLCQITVQK